MIIKIKLKGGPCDGKVLEVAKAVYDCGMVEVPKIEEIHPPLLHEASLVENPITHTMKTYRYICKKYYRIGCGGHIDYYDIWEYYGI